LDHVLTAEERVKAAIALQKTDRVPLGHSIDSFAAKYAGITQEQWWFDHEKANEALIKTFRDLGPWDTSVLFAPGHHLAFALSAPMRVKLPGRDLPPDTPMQFDESEIMTPEDYDSIIEQGYEAFLEVFFPRLGINPAIIPEARAAIARHSVEDAKTWRAMGVHVLCGTKLRLPYDWFAYARSLKCFLLDLFKRPAKVTEAMDIALASMLDDLQAKLSGLDSNGIFVPMARGSATFVSPKQFERFCLPWLKTAVETLVAWGCTPVLHCDANWTPLLPLFRELPARRCILQLDEQTDIHKAKEVLGDHMCIHGNVSPSLLCLGSAADVEQHCRHLVETIGQGGGFILGPACTMPMATKPDNVQAMTRAVLDQ
jgi:hypothetical protein